MDKRVKLVNIEIKDVVLIALEAWRISKIADENEAILQNVGLKFALRKIKKVIGINRIQTIDPTGEKYDSGMALDVIDSVKDKCLEELYIMETIEPIIMYDNQVVNRGKVILDAKD